MMNTNNDHNSDVFFSSDWTSVPPFSASNALHRSLEETESSLRCPVCHDFLRIPVDVSGCRHTFCSECVRTALRAQRKSGTGATSCPSCRAPTDERRLAPNRSLARVVELWRSTRSSLRSALSSAAMASKSKEGGKEEEEEEDGEGNETKKEETVGTKRKPDDNDDEDDDYDPYEEENISRKRRVLPRRKTLTSTTTTTTVGTARQRSLPASTSSVATSSSSSSTGASLKHRAATHYHGMRRRDLLKLCRDEGLLVEGSRSDNELREAHKRFVDLWNAECDSEVPRTREEIVRDANAREATLRVERSRASMTGTAARVDAVRRLLESVKETDVSKTTTDNNGATTTTTGKATAPTSGDRTFDRKFNDGFNSLIRNYKKRASGVVQDDGHGKSSSTANHDDEPPCVKRARVSAALAEREETSSSSFSSSSLASTRSFPSGSSASDATTTTCTPSRTTTRTSTKAKQKMVDPKSSSSGQEGTVGSWTCSTCTFFNERNTWSRARCEMCGVKRATTMTAPKSSPAKHQKTIVTIDVG